MLIFGMDAEMDDERNHWERDPVVAVDPLAETQPTNQLTQVVKAKKTIRQAPRLPRFPVVRLGCLSMLIGIAGILAVISAYLFFPGRTNVLILGIDDRQEGQAVGRSDTMILTSFQPLPGKVSLLSIPRDLWVNVPGHGENRINTAHFFAEAESPGAGIQAARQVVADNFSVDVDSVIRFRFDSFKNVIDSFGGLEVTLDEPMSGYTAGRHSLNSEEALAFVRDRTGTDDFFRMERGQIFIRAVFEKLLSVDGVTKLPQVLVSLVQAIETDLPVYLWPRLGVNLLRAGSDGINSRSISRDMVNPFTTSGGAQVLAPNWELIDPVVIELFGN